jgi:bile acid-coenzyme A ligase
MSYGRALALFAQRDPLHPAIVFEELTVTRGEFDARTNRLARALAGSGVGRGDFVTIALPNCPAFLEAAFAAWKLGAVPQPVSARLPGPERDAILARARPKLVIGLDRYGDTPCLPVGYQPDAGLSDAPLPDCVSPHSQAIASGGSTGTPKLIVDALPAECDPEEDFYGAGREPVVLVPGPLYHTGPFINARQTLLTGGTVILMGRFDASQALALIEGQRVEWVNFVPTMMHRIWRLPAPERDARDLSSLRIVMSSGAGCPAWLKRAWIEWLGPERIHEAYGGTERIGGTLITGTEWLEHPGSVGRPTGGRKIRVLDPDGVDLPAGEVGEIYMMPAAGPGTTYRYLGAEARATDDGWESLGDMGWLDQDGYLYIADRRTDMIVTGGANVYPAEIEGALESHPGVGSCAVIGLPDDDLGQRVHAIVQASGDVDDEALRAHLAERLVRYKVPRSFEFVREPLRDEAGKVRRSALREERLR